MHFRFSVRYIPPWQPEKMHSHTLRASSCSCWKCSAPHNPTPYMWVPPRHHTCKYASQPHSIHGTSTHYIVHVSILFYVYTFTISYNLFLPSVFLPSIWWCIHTQIQSPFLTHSTSHQNLDNTKITIMIAKNFFTNHFIWSVFIWLIFIWLMFDSGCGATCGAHFSISDRQMGSCRCPQCDWEGQEEVTACAASW